MKDIHEVLNNGNIFVLDGGIGSEIQQRGVKLNEAAWSAPANISDPHVVRASHENYIRAGADIITTNSFSAAKHVLDAAGCGADFGKINARSVELARQARDNVASGDVWIAGSLSTVPPLNKMENIRVGAEYSDGYRQQAEILAEAGVDFFLLEMMLDSREALTVVNACKHTGLPIWIGMCGDLSDDGSTVTALRPSCKFKELGNELFEDLAKNLASADVSAMGVMHSKLQVMTPALKLLSNAWSGPKMAYAEIRQIEGSSWEFGTSVKPADYARNAERWITEFGVQVVGGCCGTRPEHIKALKKMTETLREVA